MGSTGKDLVLFVLMNNLEDEVLFNEDGSFVGFITEEEAAARFGVNVATIQMWIAEKMIKAIYTGKSYLMLGTVQDPRTE